MSTLLLPGFYIVWFATNGFGWFPQFVEFDHIGLAVFLGGFVERAGTLWENRSRRPTPNTEAKT